MADSKISALSAAAALTGTEEVVIVQGIDTVKSTAQAIADLSTNFATEDLTFNANRTHILGAYDFKLQSASGDDLFTVLSNGSVFSNMSGWANSTSYGENAGINALGDNSTYFGTGAGAYTAGENTAYFGVNAGAYSIGGDNCNFGADSGRYLADGVTDNTQSIDSVYFGSKTKSSADATTNEIVIGYDAIGNGDHSATLGNDSIVTTVLKGDIGIRTATPQATLDIHGQGALSTDVVLNVRNSANTADLFTVLGDGSVFSNASGALNSTSYGVKSGYQNTGDYQTVSGFFAGRENTGDNQTASGYIAGYQNAGINQTVSGYFAGRENTGDNQTASGYYAGYQNAGNDNCNFGNESGRYIADGVTANTASSNSVYIGSGTKSSAVTTINEIVLGYNAIGNGNNSTTIGNATTVLAVLRGTLNVPDLPTSATGLNTGDVWNNSGVLNII